MQAETIASRATLYAPDELLAELGGVVRELARGLETDGLAPLLGTTLDRLRQASDDLTAPDDEPLRVVVIGEFKRGKSTLINAWLGAAVLPTDVLPETAAPVELRFGRPPDQFLRLRDGGRVALVGDELRRDALLPALEAVGGRLSHIEVVRDLPVLESCILVDTPGANDLFLRFEDAIAQAVARADLVLAVVTATAPLSATEIGLLRRVLALHDAGRLYVVLNQLDLIRDADDLARLECSLRLRLGELFPGAQVFGLSALDEMARRQGGPRPPAPDPNELAARFAGFRAELAAATSTRAAVVRLARVGSAADRAVAGFLADLQALEEALASDRNARAEALARAASARDASEQASAEERAGLLAGVETRSAEARGWLQGFVARLLDSLADQVSVVPTDQAARHLGFYVADRLQEALQACLQLHLAQWPLPGVAERVGEVGAHRPELVPELLLGANWSPSHLVDWALDHILPGGGLIVDLFSRRGGVMDPAAVRSAESALQAVVGEVVARSYSELGERLVAAAEAVGQARREQAIAALRQAEALDQAAEDRRGTHAAGLGRARVLGEQAATRLAGLRARPLAVA